ncbi:hypothetical protein [Novacetimonas maltaceti]
MEKFRSCVAGLHDGRDHSFGNSRIVRNFSEPIREAHAFRVRLDEQA